MKRQVGGVLAARFVAEGLLKKAVDHLGSANRDMARGALDQASEHLDRGFKANAVRLATSPLPGLTDDENTELINLKASKYRVSDEGLISMNILDKRREERLQDLYRLSRERSGQEKP